MVRIVGIVHRKPHGEQLDQADPVRNEETGLWQCPFCNKNDFPELSEVSTIYSCQHKQLNRTYKPAFKSTKIDIIISQ